VLVGQRWGGARGALQTPRKDGGGCVMVLCVALRLGTADVASRCGDAPLCRCCCCCCCCCRRQRPQRMATAAGRCHLGASWTGTGAGLAEGLRTCFCRDQTARQCLAVRAAPLFRVPRPEAKMVWARVQCAGARRAVEGKQGRRLTHAGVASQAWASWAADAKLDVASSWASRCWNLDMSQSRRASGGRRTVLGRDEVCTPRLRTASGPLIGRAACAMLHPWIRILDNHKRTQAAPIHQTANVWNSPGKDGACIVHFYFEPAGIPPPRRWLSLVEHPLAPAVPAGGGEPCEMAGVAWKMVCGVLGMADTTSPRGSVACCTPDASDHFLVASLQCNITALPPCPLMTTRLSSIEHPSPPSQQTHEPHSRRRARGPHASRAFVIPVAALNQW
jgi:hypothetical protein